MNSGVWTSRRLIVSTLIGAGALVAGWWIWAPTAIVIEIQAGPEGTDLFLVETRLLNPAFHGSDVRKIDERYMATNEPVRVPVDAGFLGRVFGRVHVSSLHPEYRAAELSLQRWRGRSMTLQPESWEAALARAELELVPPSLSERAAPDYVALEQAGGLVRLAEVQHHVWSVRQHYLADGVARFDPAALRRSLERLSRLAGFVRAAASRAGTSDRRALDKLEQIDTDLAAIRAEAP